MSMSAEGARCRAAGHLRAAGATRHKGLDEGCLSFCASRLSFEFILPRRRYRVPVHNILLICLELASDWLSPAGPGCQQKKHYRNPQVSRPRTIIAYSRRPSLDGRRTKTHVQKKANRAQVQPSRVQKFGEETLSACLGRSGVLTKSRLLGRCRALLLTLFSRRPTRARPTRDTRT